MDTARIEELLRKLIDQSTFNLSVLVWLCKELQVRSPYTIEMIRAADGRGGV